MKDKRILQAEREKVFATKAKEIFGKYQGRVQYNIGENLPWQVYFNDLETIRFSTMVEALRAIKKYIRIRKVE